ncbi:death domain-containing protein 1-like [Elysia marginata]|uniref:Death domain-containing protein 1-like n=1 Tax=Elysia marginata TaxID=1093978 RepID=A0AAV4J1L7_9GAST|nr:death domain-containing protein 1-like [Elysia marginata]
MSEDVCQTRFNRPKSGRPGRRGQQDEDKLLSHSEEDAVSNSSSKQAKAPTSIRVNKGRESPSLSMAKGRDSPSPALGTGRASPSPTLAKGRMSPSPSLNKGRASPSLSSSKGRESPSLTLNRGRASPSLNMGRSSPSPTKGRASPNPSMVKGRSSPTKQSRGPTGRPPHPQAPRGGRATPDDSRQSNGRSSIADTRGPSSVDDIDAPTRPSSASVFITDGEDFAGRSSDYDSASLTTTSSGDPTGTKSCDNDSGIHGIASPVDQNASPNSPTSEPEDRHSRLSRAVNTISALQESLSEMFKEAKAILTGYHSELKEKSIAEFSSQVSDFSRTFSSLSTVYQTCEKVTGNISDHLKDIRNLTSEISELVTQGAEREGIQAWVEETDQDIRDKAFLKEQLAAKQKAQEAKIQRIKMIYAKASEEALSSREMVAQAEVQCTQAEAAAIEAVHQSEEAVRKAEETRQAEESKRKAEEEAKKRAEELQRKREEEEKRKREEEERELKEAAKRRGSSLDDERFKAQLEKEKREAEARNLNNWPRFIYSIEPGDYDPGIGAIVRSQEGTLTTDDLKVSLVDQLTNSLPLGESEELISNIIDITPSGSEEQFKFPEPMAIALPHCGPRLYLGREAVVKMRTQDGQIHSLPTTEVFFDDIKELHFVQVRVRTFGTFGVFLRIKRENLSFDWRGGKLMSSVDSRVTVAWQPRAFRNTAGMTLEVQNVDQHIVTDVKKKHPIECEPLISAGCIVRFSVPKQKTTSALTITLPCPFNPAHRPVRPKTARNNSTNNMNSNNSTIHSNNKDQTPIEDRPLSARFSFGPTSTKDNEPVEEIHLLRQVDDGPWVKVEDVILSHPKKRDIVSFDISLPFTRLSVLRTSSGLNASKVEKMLNHVIEHLTWRPTCLITRQKTMDPSSVMVTCCHPTNLRRVLEDLSKEGYEHGPHPSRELNLTEGQRLELRFRGNVANDDNQLRNAFVFNSHIPFRVFFDVTEQDQFAQKGFDSYRGFVQFFTTRKARKFSQFFDDKERIFVQRAREQSLSGEELLCEHLLILPKPEPETPRPLNVARVELSSGGAMTEDLLRFLSQNLQYNDWKRLAQLLNVRSSRVQAILRQNMANDTSCVIYDLLVTWSKRLPRVLDRVEVLKQALTTIGRTDLAQELQARDAEAKANRTKQTRDAHLQRAFLSVVRHPLASTQWKQLARYLDVDEEEIEVIEIAQNTPQERCHKSLHAWRDQQGEHATVQLLTNLLRSCRYPKLAKEIESTA